MTAPTKRKGRQLFAVPMRRYTVFLDAGTAEYYRVRGGGNRSEGMRVAVRDGLTAPPKDQSSREA